MSCKNCGGPAPSGDEHYGHCELAPDEQKTAHAKARNEAALAFEENGRAVAKEAAAQASGLRDAPTPRPSRGLPRGGFPPAGPVTSG